VVRKLARELSNAALDSGVSFNLVVSDPKEREKAIVLETEEFITGRARHVRPPMPEIAFKSRRYLLLRRIWKLFRKIDFLNFLQSRFFRAIAEKVIGQIFVSEIEKTKSAGGDSFQFQKGDVLLIADAFWGQPYTVLSLVRDAKANGARVVFLINDIFPISHPEFVDPPNAVDFCDQIPKALELADGLLYPSIATRKELEKHFYLDGIDVPHTKISYGADLEEASWIYENIKRVPRSILMLGTVEPRKNHRLVLKWFLSMADKKVKLTVIGKNGWLAESLTNIMTMESHRNTKKFSWRDNASDDELAFEMLRHEVGIMASHAEGLGLPVLEYSRSGLKLVLNDIPIFREVAGDAAFYFDGSSVESLDRAINDAFQSDRVATIPEVSWRDTANEAMAFIQRTFK
jgi:glycosyltransferase involved in cell wall biosynthesis